MRSMLFLLAAAACATAGPAEFSSGPARVSLIELYTSEGCSSCPPAEKWLGALGSDTGLWKTFVPVAFHVNYWDRLGWPDQFASRAGTQREFAYADAWRSGSVYTPCVVRDGAEWTTRPARIPAFENHETAGRLTASYQNGVVRAEFTPAPPRPGEQFEIHAALLGAGIVSKVAAGENSGATLRHEFVALALADGAPGVDLPLAAPQFAGVPRHALAVWVTRRGELTPQQATGGWLSP